MTTTNWQGVQPCTVVDAFAPDRVTVHPEICPSALRARQSDPLDLSWFVVFQYGNWVKPTPAVHPATRFQREPFGNLQTAAPQMMGVLFLDRGWMTTTDQPCGEGAD